MTSQAGAAVKASLAGVVLAAGLSRRMGRDKTSLVFRGASFLELALHAAQALDTVVLVGGPVAPPGVRGVTWVPAPAGGEPSQSRSLRAGLLALPGNFHGAMVFLADMPLVSRELAHALARAFVPGRFLVPVHQGRRGNPVVIPSSWFGEVGKLAGDTGARPLLARPDAPVDYFETYDPAVVTDVDTPEDLARLMGGQA